MLFASAAALPLLLGAAGCRSSDAFTGPDPLAGRPPLGRDVLTLQAVIAAEENLIGLYQAALRGGAGNGGAGNGGAAGAQTLRTLLSQHEQHLAQLKARLVVPPGASASASPSASGTGGATASPGPGRV